MQSAFRSFLLAVMFLTRAPVRLTGDAPPDALGRAYWAFPLVGSLIGAMVGGLYWGGLSLGLPPMVAAAAALGAGMALTGALHEDGLADCADALGAPVDRERTLEILRDSRIGAFGALALVVSQIVRIAALASLGGPAGLLACVAVQGASRGWAVGLTKLLAPARRGFDAGLAAQADAGSTAAWAVALSVVLPFALIPPGAAFLLAMAGALGLGTALLLAKRRLGGYTGDVIGAVQQLVEIAMLVLLAAWFAP